MQVETPASDDGGCARPWPHICIHTRWRSCGSFPQLSDQGIYALRSAAKLPVRQNAAAAARVVSADDAPSASTAGASAPTTVTPAVAADDLRRWGTVFSLAILHGVASAGRERRGAPAELALGQSSSPALACIIGAFRPCTAPMNFSRRSLPGRCRWSRGRRAELALDQRQWDPLVEELHSVFMPKLVGCEPAPDPSLNCEMAQLCAR